MLQRCVKMKKWIAQFSPCSIKLQKTNIKTRIVSTSQPQNKRHSSRILFNFRLEGLFPFTTIRRKWANWPVKLSTRNWVDGVSRILLDHPICNKRQLTLLIGRMIRWWVVQSKCAKNNRISTLARLPSCIHQTLRKESKRYIKLMKKMNQAVPLKLRKFK